MLLCMCFVACVISPLHLLDHTTFTMFLEDVVLILGTIIVILHQILDLTRWGDAKKCIIVQV
jgi:hypothetical protein